METDRNPDAPYGVICEGQCGKQGLTKEDYTDQMNHPNRTWICPICRGYADWDDERYEKSYEKERD